MKFSWHSYQLFMSLKIKCFWNHRMDISIESRCFILVYFISYDMTVLETTSWKLPLRLALDFLGYTRFVL